MTQEQRNNAIAELLRDVLLDLIADADEAKLLEAYAILRGYAPGESEVGDRVDYRAALTPPPPSQSGEHAIEFPAATIAVVRRAALRIGGPFKLSEIVGEVHREQPAITRPAISGALGRLVREGWLERSAEQRNSTYTPPAGEAKRAG